MQGSEARQIKLGGESGGIQAPEAWARSPGGLGAGGKGLGFGASGGLPNLSNYDFSANLLQGAWQGVGVG